MLAIDPGPTLSGWVLWDDKHRRVVDAGTDQNDRVLASISDNWRSSDGTAIADRMAIEKIEAMGMAVGASTFETVHWSGRFLQAWHSPDEVLRITRRQVKLHLCGSMQAKDANVRQALIDLLGPQGTKREPGPTYGVAGHEWAALAVAVTAAGTLPLEQKA